MCFIGIGGTRPSFTFSLSTAVMSVSMKPGAMALQVTPREASSLATDLVRPTSPALAGGVVRLPGVAHQAGDGGDVDDPAAAALMNWRIAVR